MNHLAFSSVEVVGEMPDVEVEKAVDKIGRTARRTTDTHIKNVLSKPRVATTMRRMTAMFNFSAELPSISSIDEKPDLRVEPTVVQKKVEKPTLNEHLKIKRGVTSERNYGGQAKPMVPDSATESDADGPADKKKHNFLSSFAGPSKQDENKMDDRPTLNRLASSPTPAPVAKVNTEPSSGSESSPHRPTKRPKAKISSSSDEDSESGSKPRMATGSSSGGTRRGAAPRQPIKRGGKRF